MLTTVAHGKVVVDIPETVILKGVAGGELAKGRVLTGQEEAMRFLMSVHAGSKTLGITHGALLMLSIPPAATTDLSPSLMDWAASMTDFMPLAQTLLMVVASDVSLMPAPRATWRAGDWPTPACTTLPI